MTNTNDIQQARDVLAKWRQCDNLNQVPAPWGIGHPADGGIVDSEGTPISHGWDGLPGYVDGTAAALIVGTAGNPDLLDAIDGVLEAYIGRGCTYHPLAAAIIAADERMTS